MIVTIDGPAGTGKSTVAKQLAARLAFEHLDTGAMYRMVGLFMLDEAIDLEDASGIAAAIERVELDFQNGRCFLNAVDVTDHLRTRDVAFAASKVAAIPAVRSALDDQQRSIADGRDIVCEGRDQGTVVFPDAERKFYLTAEPEERARRRQLELEKRGTQVDLAQLLKEQTERDERDQNRSIAPLRPAEDAIIVDTTAKNIDEVVEYLRAVVGQ